MPVFMDSGIRRGSHIAKARLGRGGCRVGAEVVHRWAGPDDDLAGCTRGRGLEATGSSPGL